MKKPCEPMEQASVHRVEIGQARKFFFSGRTCSTTSRETIDDGFTCQAFLIRYSFPPYFLIKRQRRLIITCLGKYWGERYPFLFSKKKKGGGQKSLSPLF